MTGGVQVLGDLPLAVDPDDVLRLQGYRLGQDAVDGHVRGLLRDALAEASGLMAPRAAVRWCPVTARQADELVLGAHRLRIPGIADRWGAVDQVAVAICTIGDALEQRVAARWESRELPLASMLDSVGSSAVESLGESVHQCLCREGAVAGLAATGRLSPGWGTWDVGEQRALFALCPGEAIGVTLNDAAVMMPVKSMSLVVGIGMAARVEERASPCARCGMRACAYRRGPVRAAGAGATGAGQP